MTDSRIPLTDSADARERRLAKLDLLTIVDEIGVPETTKLLPRLGMVEHFGLPTVTHWLTEIAARKAAAS